MKKTFFFLFLILFLPFTSHADWGSDNGWAEKVEVSITNSSGSSLTDHQVLVTFSSVSLISDGKIQPDGDDIRFLDANDSTVLDYWIETDTINTSATRIWVKIPSIPVGQKIITMYYDKTSASGVSSGPDTFIDFIDFNTDGVIHYAGSQDQQSAQYEIQDSGSTLRMYGNNWKATNISLNLSNMKLDFDFKSAGVVAEINGIGFDTETNGLNANWFYKCLGTQNWGSYSTTPAGAGSGEWEKLGMVLDDFGGNFSYLIFANDADAGQNTNIFYRNVRVRKYATPEPVTEVQLPVSQIVFITSAQTIYTDRPSDIMTIETRDISNSTRNVQADTTITLSSSSSGGRFSLSDSPFTSVDTITISAGTSSASFYYRDSRVGTPSITAAESPDAGWTGAAQQQEVVSPGAYSVAVEISSTMAATDCQVLVVFNTQALVAAGQMKANGDDIRFFDTDDTTELSYWIEPDTMNSASTRIWVKIPQVPNGTKNINMHYGNPDAASKSSGEDTFIEFIDFNTDGVISYGGGQDTNPAQYEIQDSGYTLRMYGNNWKASNISLAMNSTMKLEFDFKSSGTVAEINGIGFDTDTSSLNANWFYKCIGTQSWGSYSTSPAATGSGEWESLGMALDDFSGNFSYLVFSNDADAGQNTNIFYRYVRIRKTCGDSASSDVKFPLARLAFTTSAQSIFEDRVSNIITIQAQDIGGTGRNVDENMTVALETTSETGEFSLSSSPFQPVTSVIIPSGQDSVSFYYRDSVPGNYILTASESPSQGLTDATQSITVNAVSVDWHYRLPLTIQNTCGDHTDYQVLVPINTNTIIALGKMQADGADIRFNDSDDETPLNYWIETDTINTAATRLWVKVPDLPLGSKTIYLYYGNETAATASSGPDTFIDFIDFNTDGVIHYAGSQDQQSAQYEIQGGGYNLYMYGNNWKAANISQTLDGTTRLDLGFQSTGAVAEINGVGFDTETSGLNPEWFYKCLGTQNWGSYSTTPVYSQSGTWERLSLELDKFAGTFSYLIFCNDADAGQNTQIYYRDVRIRKYCDPEPTIIFGEEESVITHIVFTTLSQTLFQNEPSAVITLQTRDRNNDPSNVNTDTVITLSTTSSGGSFSLSPDNWANITGITIPSGQNTVSFYYKDSLVGQPTITAKEFPSMGWVDATQQFIIISRVAHFDITAATPQVAGIPFTITVTAKDADGNIVESYAGTVQIEIIYVSPNSGTYLLTPETITGFENGIASALCQYNDSGTISITATDTEDPLKTGTSIDIFFTPSQLLLEADILQTVSQPFSLQISALNANGDITPNYIGPALLNYTHTEPSAPQNGMLSPQSVTDFSNGIANVNVLYNKWGQITLQAADSTDSTKTGLTEPIMFLPKDFLIEVQEPPPTRTFFYINEDFDITVLARDFNGERITNYMGRIDFLPVPEILGLTPYTFTSSDAGAKNLTISSLIEQGISLQVTDSAYNQITGTSSMINSKYAKIRVISAAGSVGSIETRVEIVDGEDNIISSDNSTEFTVTLVESSNNNSASSDAAAAPVKISQGNAFIIITDLQAETVTVTPESTPELDIEEGEIIFGSIGDKGIRIRLWREKDD